MRKGCGLDIYKDSVFACILCENGEKIHQKFGVLTSDTLRDLLVNLMYKKSNEYFSNNQKVIADEIALVKTENRIKAPNHLKASSKFHAEICSMPSLVGIL